MSKTLERSAFSEMIPEDHTSMMAVISRQIAELERARNELMRSPYGTMMKAPRGQTAMSLGTGYVYCFDHNCIEPTKNWTVTE